VHGITTMLTIKDLATTDFDDYNCTVVNALGSDSALVTLSQTGNY